VQFEQDSFTPSIKVVRLCYITSKYFIKSKFAKSAVLFNKREETKFKFMIERYILTSKKKFKHDAAQEMLATFMQ